MRTRKSGHIINLSSIGGLVSFAVTGYYHATKFAVEGLSGSLAIELAPLNIKVTVRRAWTVSYRFCRRSIAQSKTEIADYAETAGMRRQQTFARDGKQQGDPVRAAQAIIEIAASPNPPLHLLLGEPALDLARKDLESKRNAISTPGRNSLSVPIILMLFRAFDGRPLMFPVVRDRRWLCLHRQGEVLNVFTRDFRQDIVRNGTADQG